MHRTRLVYVCGHPGCGRVVYPNDSTRYDWLIQDRIDDPAILIVRCPQHVTERTLRYAGVPLEKATFRNVRIAKERDAKRGPDRTVPGLIVPIPPHMLAAVMEHNMHPRNGRKKKRR